MDEFETRDPDGIRHDPRSAHDSGHLLVAPARRPRRLAALGIATAVVLTAGAGAGAWASLGVHGTASAAVQDDPSVPRGGQGLGGQDPGEQGLGGQGLGGGSGPATTGGGSAGVPASAAQRTGVVTVVSRLGYDSAASAGTGIVLTGSGRVLTNNHVIEGATAIRVTDGTTDRTYRATVVGTAADEDIAVLQLEDASGLSVADLADAPARAGDEVTAVGNAGGTGTLSAAEGTVTATDRDITTRSEGASGGESLQGLIETDADVISGDSGGPLQDADGDVVGITTAATAGSDDPTGYAIPIATALAVAQRIVSGDDSDGITIGLPAFLGVSIDPAGDGAVIARVIEGSAAAATDLAEGDTITAVDGRAVTSAEQLTAAVRAHRPGERVTVTSLDPAGDRAVTRVVLGTGPAD